MRGCGEPKLLDPPHHAPNYLSPTPLLTRQRRRRNSIGDTKWPGQAHEAFVVLGTLEVTVQGARFGWHLL